MVRPRLRAKMTPSRIPSPLMPPLFPLFILFFVFSSHVFAIAAVLGIDLGTDHLKASLVRPGAPVQIVLTKESRRKEISAVAFKPPPNGARPGAFPERLYGSDAMALAPRFPHDVYPSLKTVLGQLVDSSPAVVQYLANNPGLLIDQVDERGTVAFRSSAFAVGEDSWMVEELLAMQLQSIQRTAEAMAGAGTTISSIVLTVPAFYTTEEKRAVQTATEIAGLRVLSLISDGLAVGLHYATAHQFPNINESGSPEYHLVFDMGAGSSKAAVIKFQSRNVKDGGKSNKTIQEVQVVGNSWDRTLGGHQLNELIVNDMIAQFIQSSKAQSMAMTANEIKTDGRTMAKLSKEAERIRQILSANTQTQASLESLYRDVDLRYQISRADFETMCEEHAIRVANVVKEALKSAQVEANEIASVILHGGSSRTPFVQKQLEAVIGSAEKIRTSVNADEAAVMGAGFRAADLSPSFRVKEIRPLEGAMYPSGLRWIHNGKEQRQRLWTASSVVGGTVKEVTFGSLEDFDVTFYQQVGGDDRDTKTMTTTNLTAAVTQLLNEHGCAAADIRVKVGLKLKGENGEVVVVKAQAECEVEAKDSFVSGVKNLFGFGKKSQQPLHDNNEVEGPDEREGEGSSTLSSPVASSTSTTQADRSDSAPSSSASSAASSSSDVAAAESGSAKDGSAKTVVVSIPVDYMISKVGIPMLSSKNVQKARHRLKAFDSSDLSRRIREERLNQLEAFTYQVRDMLDDSKFVAASTAEERVKLESRTKSTNEWLYGDGADASKDELKTRLDELRAIADPVTNRIQEAAERPGLVVMLRDSLQSTASFLNMISQQVVDYEKWQSSATAAADTTTASSSVSAPAAESETKSVDEFEGLENDDSGGSGSGTMAAAPTASDGPSLDEAERTLEEMIEDRGPPPPLYSAEDVKAVLKEYSEALAWLDEMEAQQAALAVTADPVLTTEELISRRNSVDRIGIDLAMRGVRSFERKAKKASSEEVSRMTKTKTSGAGPDQSATSEKKPKVIKKKVDKAGKKDKSATTAGDGRAKTAAASQPTPKIKDEL